jgi:general secretion pathway protein M
MRARLRRLWESRAPRERAIIAAVAVILGALLYAAFVQTAWRARTQLRTSVTALRTQAAQLELQAAEIERLRAAPPLSASQTDLRTLVQAQVDGAGLARALVRIDAPDANQVVVVFGAVPFADWYGFIVSLTPQHVRLDTCRIEALSTPGLVSVTATLVRAKPQ